MCSSLFFFKVIPWGLLWWNRSCDQTYRRQQRHGGRAKERVKKSENKTAAEDWSQSNEEWKSTAKIKKTIFHVLFILSSLSDGIICYVNIFTSSFLKNFHYGNIKCPVLNGASWNTLQGIVLCGKQYFYQCWLFSCALVLGFVVQKKKGGLGPLQIGKRQTIHPFHQSLCCTWGTWLSIG